MNNLLKPDIEAKVILYPNIGKDFEGYKTDFMATILFNEREYFDCKVLLSQTKIKVLITENAAVVPIRFLHREYVDKYLKPGEKFKFWRGKIIGTGEFIKVIE